MKNKKKFISTGGSYQDGYQQPLLPRKMSKNEFFETNGYISLPGLITDPENLFTPPPVDNNGTRITGQFNYFTFQGNTTEKFSADEGQVSGSLARYNIPCYKQLHFLIRKQIEKVLGMDLLPTYYYDRFYYVGQELKRHNDRCACEVSVTLQISSNHPENPWPIWFERPDGSETYLLINDGDAVVYKGCERDHWRDPLPSRYNRIHKLWRKIKRISDDTYHHQIFFHYVDANGPFVFHANDMINGCN